MTSKIALVLLLSNLNVLSYNEFHIKLAHNFEGQTLNVSRCDFRGAGRLFQDLKVNFQGAQMAGVNFAPCTKSSQVPGIICIPNQVSDLSGYNFSNAQLVSANFQDAILKAADFTGADLLYANFTGADLTDAKLDGAVNISAAVFCDAIMPDGSKCSGKSWTSKSGKKILCHCHRKQ